MAEKMLVTQALDERDLLTLQPSSRFKIFACNTKTPNSVSLGSGVKLPKF